jgi:hypothetical protein
MVALLATVATCVKVPAVPSRLKIEKAAALLPVFTHERIIDAGAPKLTRLIGPELAVNPVTADGIVIAIVADADAVPTRLVALKGTT